MDSSNDFGNFLFGLILAMFGLVGLMETNHVGICSAIVFAGIFIMVGALIIEPITPIQPGAIMRDGKGKWWYSVIMPDGTLVKGQSSYKTNEEARLAQKIHCQTKSGGDLTEGEFT